MTYNEIISEVSRSTGLTKYLVDRTYRAYWKAVRQYISALPLKEDLTDEEFLRLRPNVNIPSIGKLYVTLDRYHGVKKRHNMLKDYYKNKKDSNAEDKEDQACCHKDAGDRRCLQ